MIDAPQPTLSASLPASSNRLTKLRHAGACTILVLFCSQVLAQSTSDDDIAVFMQEKGLLDKLGDQVSAAGKVVSEKASELVVTAMGFLGAPYKRGGNSFDQGLDCSGFVRLIYEQTVGMVLPRRASEQAAATQPIEKSELQPGDLVFFNTLRSAFSHVGIYVGDNKFIHSPRTGGVVRVEDMRLNYWQQRFDGARRVDATNKAPAAQR
jgi:cell wall-associated NlpC family hydrolase